MNGYLLQNPSGNLGLVVVNETRKVRNVVYDSIGKNLLVAFDDGEIEHLATEIDVTFNGALLAGKEIFIGHIPNDKLEQNPTLEYYVPLRQ